MEKVRFPIGHFEPILNPSLEERRNFIHQIPYISITLRFDEVEIRNMKECCSEEELFGKEFLWASLWTRKS